MGAGESSSLRGEARVLQELSLVRATLVHNPNAGSDRGPERGTLIADIEGIGWKVKVVEKDDLDQGLVRPGDAVLVAGGDGTVARVAKRLAGTNIPLGVIPVGTVNNVARTLGVGVDARAAIDALRSAVVRDVDLGLVRDTGGGGLERFIEGFGVGVFAWVMAIRATKKHEKPRRVFTRIADALEAFPPTSARIEIDGRNVSGGYLLACAMNLRTLGPALGLAPDARYDDGLLDVVLVRPEHRRSLLAHLRRAAIEGEVPLPHFEVHRAERMRLRGYGHGKWAHVDDRARELGREVEVRVAPRAVRFLVPS
jgi:diacylglycerol kinase family enzyme